MLHLTIAAIVVAQDVKTLRKLIFSVDPILGYSSPEKTLEYLKILLDLEPEDGQYLTRLIELSENHAEKCDSSSIKAFFVLNQQDSKGIEAYKRHQWNNRKYACLETWKKNLATEVHTLTRDEVQLVNRLTHSVLQQLSRSNYKLGFIQTGTREFSYGVLPYFVENNNHQVGELLKGQGHKHAYDDEYARLVTNLCSSFKSKLKNSIDLFELFIHVDQTNSVDDDQFIKHWLENIEVCRTVDSRKLPIQRELFKLLKEQYRQPGCVGSCFGIGSVSW